MKILLFNVDNGEAFMTNGDVVIRISDLPNEILDGLNPDIPAYDYLGERFIPNPLPYSIDELCKAFFSDFSYTVTLPVKLLLDMIYHKYPTSLERRGTFSVLDIGYGMYPGSLIIPQFFEDPKSKKKFFTLPDGTPVFVDKHSVIQEVCLELDTPYVGFISTAESIVDYPCINVYKRYSNSVIYGLYKTILPLVEDDIHPFNLEDYADNDKFIAEISSGTEHFNSPGEIMRAYHDFTPIAFETEYLFQILLTMGAFGFEEFYMHLRHDHDEPVLFEGIREFPQQPSIETVMATIELGENGQKCEKILAEGGI